MVHLVSTDRLPIVVLAIAASVLLSGCPVQHPEDGDFPKLEAAVASIDWIGDGAEPSGVDIVPGGRLPIRAVFWYEASDNDALRVEVERRLTSFDTVFTVLSDGVDAMSFEGQGWRVYVMNDTLDDGRPIVSFWVDTKADDREAAESLAPVIEVLGTTS